jgi:hypothetical protein
LPIGWYDDDVSATTAAARLAPLPIDWGELELEATEILQRYIRIDTTNPPGGEEAGAQLLADVLRTLRARSRSCSSRTSTSSPPSASSGARIRTPGR